MATAQTGTDDVTSTANAVATDLEQAEKRIATLRQIDAEPSHSAVKARLSAANGCSSPKPQAMPAGARKICEPASFSQIFVNFWCVTLSSLTDIGLRPGYRYSGSGRFGGR